ncbi:carbonate dehydratase [Enterococcus florum]|uniref:Carbonic anhydrase n=1 Tax=Enterococcus florum TaxID=2480627 RepID=A0A4P5PF93_9ENTE|nr:carbonic anhydrase family protein [Enterococcus florum]GCF94908.1 carbonate dehydratase [Enterococcus florum]
MKAKFTIDYCQQQQWGSEIGLRQSPIDIQTASVEPSTDRQLTKLDVTIHQENASFFNNGQNLQLLCQGQATLNNRPFQLIQMHFHTDSEHSIDGKKFPMEGHFLFHGINQQIAVIGVFYEIGTENAAFEEVLDHFDTETDCGSLDFNLLLPENKSYYHYLGSLTTPPLTENVEWYVLKRTVEVSAQQIDRFKEMHGHNCRLQQAINQRTVLSYNE